MRTIINGEAYDLDAEERERLTNAPSLTAAEIRRAATRGRQSYQHYRIDIINGIANPVAISFEEWVRLEQENR